MKVGSRVIMNSKYYVNSQNKGKIFTVRSNPYDCCGTKIVLLEGKRGGYAVDGLTVVDEKLKEEATK